jgi:Zn-finger nucleic acid-binding protein
MVAFELQGVEIDGCVSCHGTWLDNGELQLIADLAGVAPGTLTEALLQANGRRGAGRRCPRCLRRLDVVEVGEPVSFEIDRCPGGCGLWFDDGEMERFIERFHVGEAGAVARFFAAWFGSSNAARST